MLSESQERMLLVATKDKVKAVQDVFAKWDLDAVVIGRVTDGDRLKVRFHGETVVDIPVDSIVNLCPIYHRPSRMPDHLTDTAQWDLPEQPEDMNPVLLQLLDQPTIADKEWIFRQYDHMVQTNTVFLPGAGAAVLRLKGKDSGLAMTLDGNSLYCYLDPKTGGRIAVAEACRNLACVGAHPLGVTNCLNFGNPEKPDIMWQFQEVIEGVSEACKVFDIPVTGGNVSFYNDTEGVSILPTPVIGIVGRIDRIDKAVSPGFKNEGDIILLVGNNKEELGGSEYLRTVHGAERGAPPSIDLEFEKRLQDFVISVIEEGMVSAAADPSEGGLAVCLAECVFASAADRGCSIDLEDEIRTDALLFGESQSRIILSCPPEKKDRLLAAAKSAGVPVKDIGRVKGDHINIRHRGKSVIDIPIQEAFPIWKKSIPKRMSTKT